ncbi:MAG: ClpXP protease specificity-enhancing factor SspB [Wolbachia endosymbiont of Menacanthus eurysternus]|nr:MAG: ClpXP protease specificity-enhancing factor SspB [Wolbachia endosymbiont of Menacanthus eurysternus]
MDKTNYKKLLSSVKLQVIKKALSIISENGFTPHLEILFFTYFNDVIVPDYLRRSYPTQILIILQHRFCDLKVFESKFNVSLSFRGKQEKISVPFFAISEFHDKTSGDILIFDKCIDFDKKYSSEKYIKDFQNRSIISIDQLRD